MMCRNPQLNVRRHFDLVVSLGGNCHAAIQLRSRNLRKQSLPFDWIGTYTPDETIRYMSGGFVDRFKDACLKENLKSISFGPDSLLEGLAKCLYIDSHTGWVFLHHFNRPIEENGAYESVYAKFRMRIDRLYRKIETAKRILFVFSNEKTFDPQPCDDLYVKLLELFPGKDLNLRVMQFSAPEERSEPGRWGADGGLYLYQRAANRYDFQKTNFEWAFMDELRVGGWSRKPYGLDRIRYKIWKHLGKVLRAKGIYTGPNHG